jgi:T4 bacteriophage base plate protein
MALPKIDTPVYEIDLPLSKTRIRFRPFLVKEQRNLMMAMEADEKETIERNIRQVLHNCTLTENIDIDKLPIIDVEYYFLQLRARSVGEVVENKYRCENVVENDKCGNLMDVNLNLLEIQIETDPSLDDVIQINGQISVKLKYPEFSVIQRASKFESATDMAFDMIVESIEWIFDGEQYYYANESEPAELIEFVESLNQTQFEKIEEFFNKLPKLNKKIEVDCKKCGFHHTINVEGLDAFFV